jgi:hypothetical protein
MFEKIEKIIETDYNILKMAVEENPNYIFTEKEKDILKAVKYFSNSLSKLGGKRKLSEEENPDINYVTNYINYWRLKFLTLELPKLGCYKSIRLDKQH